MFNLILKIKYFVFLLVLLPSFANAQTVDYYIRTPGDASFEQQLMNLDFKYTHTGNVDSFKVRIEHEDLSMFTSSCIDIIPNGEEVIFDGDFTDLTVGIYPKVMLVLYTGDNACEDDPQDFLLEGDPFPAFEITEVVAVSVDEGTCYDDDPFRVCYYDWLLVQMVIVFLLSFIVYGLFINPLLK